MITKALNWLNTHTLNLTKQLKYRTISDKKTYIQDNLRQNNLTPTK